MTVPPQDGPPPGEPAGNDPSGWPAPPPWPAPQQGQPQPDAWQQPPAAYPQQPYEQPYPQQPGEWAQQPYEQQYPQQQYPQQQYPQQPGSEWAQQPPPPPGAPWGAPPAQQPPKRHGKLIAATAAVIVLAGGGIATYVAVSDSDSGTGAASPKAAINSIVDDLNNSDILGALDDLAPGERDALAQPARDTISELKRLKVLSSDADAGNVTGLTFKAQDLTFAKETVKVNDHVQIVNLTGGTLDIGSDAAKVPFSREFLKVAFPHGVPTGNTQTRHVDIGQAIESQRDGRPIRLATQRVGDKWYPSIFYTMADKMAENAIPAPSSAIPAKGAGSPEQAVKKEVDALLHGDLKTAIALVSPTELGALHDYGGVLVQSAGSAPPVGITIQTLDLTTTKISGGVRVGLKKLVLRTSSGDQVSVAITGSCADVTAGGESRHLCAEQLVTQLMGFLHRFTGADEPSAATTAALTRVITGLTKIGVDTSQVNGEWYVNPVRSMLDVSNSVLSALQQNDIINLITFFSRLDR